MEHFKIRVGVRLRPQNEREKNTCPKQMCTTSGNTLTCSTGSYTFDRVFDGHTSNHEVFEAIADPIISSFLEGFNGTIFAYGQTASGKTHTMMGSRGEDGQPGVIPLALASIFHYMEDQSSHREFILRCSYLELYNEVLTDLLDSQSGKKLTIKEDSQRNVSVQGLTEHVVMDCNEALSFILTGEDVRRVAETAMNERSSRSHTIYRLTLESKEMGGDMVKVSVLNLVDLAGSEKAYMSTDPQRFKEGVRINLSLLHLGIVIAKLSDGERYIPFRESKLTRILQNSLGGNAKTSIVCTVSPLASEETMNTLKFAGRAMRIENKPQVNELPTSQEAILRKLSKMEEENRKLRLRLVQEGDTAEKESLMLSLQARELEKQHLEQTVKALKRFIFAENPSTDSIKDKDKTIRRQTVGPMSLLSPVSPALSKKIGVNIALLNLDGARDQISKNRRLSFFPPVLVDSPERVSVGSDVEGGENTPHVHFDMDRVQVFEGSTPPYQRQSTSHKYTQTDVQVVPANFKIVESGGIGLDIGRSEWDVQTDKASVLSVDQLQPTLSISKYSNCSVQTDGTATSYSDCSVQTSCTTISFTNRSTQTYTASTNNSVQTDIPSNSTSVPADITCVPKDCPVQTELPSRATTDEFIQADVPLRLPTTTDGSVQTDVSSTTTTDGSVQTDVSSTATTDGSVQTDVSSTATTDGSVQTDVSSTVTTDGSVQTDASSTATTDGSVQTYVSSTATTDGSVQTYVSSTATTDGSVQTDVTSTTTTDGSVQTNVSSTATTDGSVQTDVSSTATTDGSVQTDVSLTATTDGSVQTDVSLTATTDGSVQTDVSTTATTDGSVQTDVSSTATTDGSVQTDVSLTATTDGSVQTDVSLTATTDGSVQTDVSSTATTDGSVQTDVSSTVTTDGSVQTDASSTATTDGSVQTYVSSTATTDGSVQTDVTSTTTADGSVQTNVSSTATTDGSVQTDVSLTATTDGSVQTDVSTTATTDGSVQTDVSLTATTDRPVQTDVSTTATTDGSVQTDVSLTATTDRPVQTDIFSTDTTDGSVQTDVSSTATTDGSVQTDILSATITDDCVRTNVSQATFTDGCVQTNIPLASYSDVCSQTDSCSLNSAECSVQTDFSTSPADCIIEKHPVLVNNLLSGVPDEGPKISVGLQTDVEHSTMEKMQQDYLVQQLQRRICDLEGKSEQSEFDLEEQKIHVEETKEKLCQVEEERESIKHQYELLIDAHSCLKDKLSQLRQEKADLVQKCNSLQSEVNTMIENECESVDNLQQKISDMENENANLRNNISEFKVKMEDVASMYQSKMEEAQQEVLDLNKANSRLKCESEKTFAEREHMIIELNALSEAKEQAHSDYKGLLARMNAGMKNHQQTVAKVQQQLVDGEMEKQCLMEKNRDLARLYEDMKAQYKEFVTKNAELLANLTASRESYESLEEKFKQVYQQKHALEQERIKYSQELDKIEEKLQIAEREKRECEGMVQLATRKSVDLETEKQCLMEKNRDLAKLCEDTKAQCEEFVSKNDELLVKLTSSKESYEGLELKFKQVYQQKRALEQERIKYHQELDEIEERLQIAEQEKEEYKRMLQAATEEDVHEEKAQLQREIQSLKEELDNYQRKVKLESADDQLKVEEIEKKFKIVYEQKRTLEMEVTKYSQELDDLEEKLEKQALQEEKGRHQLSAANEQIKLLMGERTHLSHEIKKLRSNQKQVNVKDDPVNSDDSVALASAQVQLKKVMEEKRNIENQRNKLGQEISALEDNVEVLSMENKKLEDENKRLKKTMSEQKWINVPSKQDPIGYGCGLSLEYRNYQLELELGAAQKKLKSLSALEVSAKEVEDLRRKLSSKEQYCLNLERKIAEYMKKPLQDVNCNQPQPQKIAQPVQQKSVTFPEIHKEKSHPIECNESVTGECKTQ